MESYQEPPSNTKSETLTILNHFEGLDLTESELNLLQKTDEAVNKTLEKIQLITEGFKEVDIQRYQQIQQSDAGSLLSDYFHELYLVVNGINEKNFIYVTNSYDLNNLRRRLLSFYFEFDQSEDKRLQKKELDMCLDYLAKEEYIGKEKMLKALELIGIRIDTKLSFLKEGEAAQKLLTQDKLNEVWMKIKSSETTGESTGITDYIDLKKFAPYLCAFFMEYQTKILFHRRKIYKSHLGIPFIIDPNTGKEIENPDGSSYGLYRTFLTVLKERKSLDDTVSYRDVVKAVNEYRSNGYTESLTLESLERIFLHARVAMKVDLTKGFGGIKMKLRDILPLIATDICTECTWNTAKIEQEAEKYDLKVHWEAAAFAEKLSKENIHEALARHCNLAVNPILTKKQLIQGFHEVLTSFIPTIKLATIVRIIESFKNTQYIVCPKPMSFNLLKILEDHDIYHCLYECSLIRLKEFIYYINSIQALDIRLRGSDYENVDRAMKKKSLNNFLVKNITNEVNQAELIKKNKEFSKIERDIKFNLFLEQLYDDYEAKMNKTKKFAEEFSSDSDESGSEAGSGSIVLEQEEMAYKLLRLQAEANRIDRRIEERDCYSQSERLKKESIAFPNNKDIMPSMILPILDNSDLTPEELALIKHEIEYQGRHLSFQDLYKRIMVLRMRKWNNKKVKQNQINRVIKPQKSDRDIKHNSSQKKPEGITPSLVEGDKISEKSNFSSKSHSRTKRKPESLVFVPTKKLTNNESSMNNERNCQCIIY